MLFEKQTLILTLILEGRKNCLVTYGDENLFNFTNARYMENAKEHKVTVESSGQQVDNVVMSEMFFYCR